MKKGYLIAILVMALALLLTACQSAQAKRGEQLLDDLGQRMNGVLPNTGRDASQGAGEPSVAATGRGVSDAPGKGNGNDKPGKGNSKEKGRGNTGQGKENSNNPNQYFSISTLIGLPVSAKDGTSIGVVDSLLVQPESGKILYVVIHASAAQDADREFFLIPWNALSLNQDAARDGSSPGNSGSALIYDLDEEILNGSPGFSKDYLAKLEDGDIDPGVEAYWAEKVGKEIPGNQRGRRFVRLSQDAWKIVAVDRDGDRRDLGTLDDVIIDLPEGQVSAVIVSVAGFLDTGGEYIAIPFKALEWPEFRGASGGLGTQAEGDHTVLLRVKDLDALDSLPSYDHPGDIPLDERGIWNPGK